MLGNLFLLSGFMLITFAPIIFIVFRRYLTQTKTSKDAHKYIHRVGLGYIVSLVVAVPLFTIWIATVRIENDVMRYLFSPAAIFEACVALLGEYLLTQLFACDLLVVVMATIRKNDLSMIMASMDGAVEQEEGEGRVIEFEGEEGESDEGGGGKKGRRRRRRMGWEEVGGGSDGEEADGDGNKAIEKKLTIFHEHMERQNQLVKLLVKHRLDLTTQKEESLEMEKFFDS